MIRCSRRSRSTEIATAADKEKLQLHAHAIGDLNARMALNAYEAAPKANGARDSRHQITHLELVDPPTFRVSRRSV